MFDLLPWRCKEEEPSSLSTPWLLRREFDDMIERFFGDDSMISRGSFGRIITPAVNIAENENEITVTAEIPGMEKDDLDVSLTGDTLTIKGEKKVEHEERSDNFHRFERSYGSFSRSLSLPCEVQHDKVDASYKNGVLTLKLPKAEDCRSKSVKIPLQ